MSKIRRKMKRYKGLKRHANSLAAKAINKRDPFKPIPELTREVEYKREYTEEWNKETGEFGLAEHLYVKLLTDPDKPKYWKEIDPSKVISKPFPTSSKKRYLYSVANNKSPP